MALLIRTILLSTIAIPFVGCTSATTPDGVPSKEADQRSVQNQQSTDPGRKRDSTSVTLHLAGMNHQLKILWGDWPNKVKQALAELDGVVSVEDEWERELESDEDLDLLFVTYDAEKITLANLIDKVKESGFAAEVKQ